MARTKEEATSAVATPEGPKRRGRPPKDAGVKKTYTPTGRPRGRPPKGDVAVPRKPPSGRGRGRPKGSTKKKDGEATATTPKAKKVDEVAADGSAKRPRGRPRKSDASTGASTPKARGRPKKAAKVEEAGSDIDAEADAASDADLIADMDLDAEDVEDGSDTGAPLSDDDGAVGKLTAGRQTDAKEDSDEEDSY